MRPKFESQFEREGGADLSEACILVFFLIYHFEFQFYLTGRKTPSSPRNLGKFRSECGSERNGFDRCRQPDRVVVQPRTGGL